jgi:hypothetical protein
VFKQCSYQVYGPDICAYMHMTPGPYEPKCNFAVCPKQVPNSSQNGLQNTVLGILQKPRSWDMPQSSRIPPQSVPNVPQSYPKCFSNPLGFFSYPKTAFPMRFPTVFPKQFGNFTVVSQPCPKTIPNLCFENTPKILHLW